MFPVEFARYTVDVLCPKGASIIDPFCGRGTVPFVAQATGRHALGADVNPVAWLYSQAKLNPHHSSDDILDRVGHLLKLVESRHCQPENDFQELAWSSKVLGFLNVAREVLEWHQCGVDQTLMALILVHLHAKLGEGLSNQLRQSKAMSPEYSVRWWKTKGFSPPEMNIQTFFKKKIEWRYKNGIPRKTGTARVNLGDARTVFSEIDDFRASLVFTSPPYCGVTNYRYDNWIRLWMLGEGSLPDCSQASRYTDRAKYRSLLDDTFSECARLSRKNALVYVRTDAREFTLEATVESIVKNWPKHQLYCKYDRADGPTQTALFGNSWTKAGEVDLIAAKPGAYVPDSFHLVRSLRADPEISAIIDAHRELAAPLATCVD